VLWVQLFHVFLLLKLIIGDSFFARFTKPKYN
jgi:hypothetical protein